MGHSYVSIEYLNRDAHMKDFCVQYIGSGLLEALEKAVTDLEGKEQLKKRAKLLSTHSP